MAANILRLIHGKPPDITHPHPQCFEHKCLMDILKKVSPRMHDVYAELLLFCFFLKKKKNYKQSPMSYSEQVVQH